MTKFLIVCVPPFAHLSHNQCNLNFLHLFSFLHMFSFNGLLLNVTVFTNKVKPPISDQPKCQAWVVAYKKLDDIGSKMYPH